MGVVRRGRFFLFNSIYAPWLMKTNMFYNYEHFDLDSVLILCDLNDSLFYIAIIVTMPVSSFGHVM